MMIRLALAAVLFTAAAPAAAERPSGVVVQLSSGMSRWELHCSGGRLKSVRIIFLEPGELVLQMPPDLCKRRPKAPPPQPQPPAGRT